MLTLQRPPPLVLHNTQRCDRFDRDTGTPDARALDRIGIETALSNHVLPLQSAGAITPVAVSSRADFRRIEPHLSSLLGPIACRLATKPAIEAALLDLRQAHLARRAETRTPLTESCRAWSTAKMTALAVFGTATLVALWVYAPALLLWALIGWASLTLLAVTGLRAGAAVAQLLHLRRRGRTWRSTRSTALPPSRLPPISVLVPLYSEKDIAAHLIKRLTALDYPRDRLEVVLILEWGDTTTEAALRAT
ncbi:MAG: hypothetical protein AAF230_06930, partial [Pseudomonadota bacterium]